MEQKDQEWLALSFGGVRSAHRGYLGNAKPSVNVDCVRYDSAETKIVQLTCMDVAVHA